MDRTLVRYAVANTPYIYINWDETLVRYAVANTPYDCQLCTYRIEPT